MSTTVTMVGNVTREPELKFIPSGASVCEFGIAINTRRKEGDRWVDGDPEFYDVSCWRELAENVAESITKGTRVVVIGKLSFRTWEKDGEKRSKVSITADEVSPSLRWATAQVSRNERSSGDGGYHRQDAPPVGGDEEPFRVDAGDWQPGLYGSYPERLLD